MSGVKISTMEVGKHKIERQIVEMYRPFCNYCNRVVDDIWEETLEPTRRALVAHLVVMHGKKIADADGEVPPIVEGWSNVQEGR